MKRPPVERDSQCVIASLGGQCDVDVATAVKSDADARCRLGSRSPNWIAQRDGIDIDLAPEIDADQWLACCGCEIHAPCRTQITIEGVGRFPPGGVKIPP